ncbi:MAG: hypothetical protein RJA52_1292 [Bacteroidota bacterium]
MDRFNISTGMKYGQRLREGLGLQWVLLSLSIISLFPNFSYSQNFSCLNNFLVSLNDSCEATITPSMILSCDGDCITGKNYAIQVAADLGEIPSSFPASKDFTGENLVTFSGFWHFGLFEKKSDNSWTLICGGSFEAEDKIDPRFAGDKKLEAIFLQNGTYSEVIYTFFDRELGERNIYKPGIWSCWQSIQIGDSIFTWPDDESRLFDSLTIIPAETGIYTFLIGAPNNTGSPQPGFEPVISIYGEKGFDPENPCNHRIGFAANSFLPNISGGIGFLDSIAPWLLYPYPILRTDIALESGKKYTLVVSSKYPNVNPDFDDYKIFIVRDAFQNPQILEDEMGTPLRIDTSYNYFEFLCTDFEKVILTNQDTLHQESYATGGSYRQIKDRLGYPADWAIINETWYNYGQSLLRLNGPLDTFLNFFEGGLGLRQPEKEYLVWHYGFKPLVIENCGDWEVIVSDELSSSGDCQSKNITRTYLLKDKGSKTDYDTARIELFFRNLTLYDVRLPHYTVYIDCNENPGMSSPFIASLNGFKILSPQNPICNLSASYEDVAFVSTCSGGRQFRREWTITDWCNPSTSIIYNQLIFEGDFNAPQIEKGKVQWQVNPENCLGEIIFEPGLVSDFCSDLSSLTSEIRVYDKNQNEVAYFDTALVEISGLELEEIYSIVHKVTDECGNFSSDTISFEIKDDIAPSCLIDNLLNASISGEVSFLRSFNLDAGSYDNCQDLIFSGRRQLSESSLLSFLEKENTDLNTAIADGKIVIEGGVYLTSWSDLIPFFCSDSIFKVHLKVTEDRINGLHSWCSTEVKVEDKRKPVCKNILQEIPFSCDEFNGNPLEYFDSLSVESNTCYATIFYDSLMNELNSCDIGTITQLYRIYNPSGKIYSDTCYHKIDFYALHDYEIRFPADQIIQCKIPNPENPSYTSSGCDLIGLSKLPVERFEGVGGECYKEFITYRFINWCEYDGNGLATIVPSREEGAILQVKYSEFTSPEKIVAKVDSNRVEWKLIDIEPGFFQYRQKVVVFDNSPPNATLATENLVFPSFNNDVENGCPSEFSLRYIIWDSCSQTSLVDAFLDLFNDKTGALGEFDYSLDSGIYTAIIQDSILLISGQGIPLGQHHLKITLRDDCGNLSSLNTTFSMEDKIVPSPICINGLVVVLMPADGNGDGLPETGLAEIVPENILASTIFPDCSGPVFLSIGGLEDTPDITRKKMIYTCADPLLETLPVRVYVWDSVGNYDFCETYIILEDNSGSCKNVTEVEVSGIIFTEEDEPVESVQIQFSGDGVISGNSNADGLFNFQNIAPGYDYSIAPFKNNDPINGVTTFDLVLISKHILRVRLLDSPYQMIAADANNSGTITTLDLIQFRKLILRLDENLKENTSWRFVPVSYNFLDPLNPWKEKWPEIINLNNLLVPMNEGDFIGIKIGDVNASVKSNSNQPGYRSNFSKTVFLEYEEQFFEHNQVFEVDFFLESPIDLQGFQFTFEYDSELLEIENISSPIFQDFNSAHFIHESLFTGMWYNNQGNSYPEKPVLLKILFRAKGNGNLKNSIQLTSSKTQKEVFSIHGEFMEFSLKSIVTQPVQKQLVGNWPNPFQHSTNVEFYSDTEDKATIHIHEISGKLTQKFEVEASQGMNKIQVNGLSPGVYILSLTIGQWTENIKMVATN